MHVNYSTRIIVWHTFWHLPGVYGTSDLQETRYLPNNYNYNNNDINNNDKDNDDNNDKDNTNNETENIRTIRPVLRDGIITVL